MSWIHGFELMCYGIVGIMLLDLLRKKDYDSLFTFGSAALVGFTMELLAVAVTDIYYYNPYFYLNLGVEPKQFPVFGGLMWGGLTVYGIKLAEKLRWPPVKTAFAAGMFIVTMDILLDVAAIRLDGGFWVWVGKEITLGIDQHTFMSLIWVNFLGYMIETPTVVLLTLKKREKVKETDWYYNAVLWAVENGITGGTSATTFSPDAPCTRAQVTTFLYASQGKPTVNGSSDGFSDVDEAAWYNTPVMWAVENGVTSGVGDGRFGPDQTCTRAQVATFLYKVMN